MNHINFEWLGYDKSVSALRSNNIEIEAKKRRSHGLPLLALCEILELPVAFVLDTVVSWKFLLGPGVEVIARLGPGEGEAVCLLNK